MGLIALIVLTEASNDRAQFIEVYSESGDNRAQT